MSICSGFKPLVKRINIDGDPSISLWVKNSYAFFYWKKPRHLGPSSVRPSDQSRSLIEKLTTRYLTRDSFVVFFLSIWLTQVLNPGTLYREWPRKKKKNQGSKRGVWGSKFDLTVLSQFSNWMRSETIIETQILYSFRWDIWFFLKSCTLEVFSKKVTFWGLKMRHRYLYEWGFHCEFLRCRNV